MSAGTDTPVGIVNVNEVVPLQTILRSLTFMANDMKPSDMNRQLKECGCYRGDEPDKRQMLKALSVAVNEAIQEKVEPMVDNMVRKEELCRLLESDGYHFFRPDFFKPRAMTSPLDLARLLNSDAPPWLVKNIIERQFDIEWDTPDGEPADFTFYDFCDTKETTQHFEYDLRRAHVEVTLYKECRRKPDRRKKMHDLVGNHKNALCPEVYVNTVHGFKIWQAYGEEHKEGRFMNDVPIDLSWINESIFKFIKENSDVQKSDDKSLKQCLAKPTVYWLVIDDTDFKEGEELKLKSIGRTQVYVGQSKNGVKRRWLKDGNNHCQMTKKCLKNVYEMKTYEPLTLEGILLVQARLALARVRGERSALFVVKTFGDDLEKAEIAVSKAEASLAGKESELAKIKKQLDDTKDKFPILRPACNMISSQGHDSSHELERLKAVAERKVKEQQLKLVSANAAVRRLKKKTPSQLKDEGLLKLKQAEKSHRNGKRVGESGENIIPHKEITWMPKDMGYGMNGR